MATLPTCILAVFVGLTAPDALGFLPPAPAALALAGALEVEAAECGASVEETACTASHDRQDRGQKPHAGKPAEGSDGKERRDRWKWWLHNREELNITDRQSAEIDKIFESTMPAQRAKREELERLEAVLSTLTTENKADVATVAQQAEKVESLRAEMGKTRTVMLYRMNLLLSPEQRVKVKALIDKREAERRKDSDPSRRR